MYTSSNIYKTLIRTILIASLFLPISIYGQIDTKMEAEDTTNYTELSGTTILKPGSGSASGGSWILLKNNPNGSLKLTVNDIPTAGAYKLNMYCFNNNISQTATFSLNDGVTSVIAINPSNWEYQGLPKRTTLDVNLNVGTNTFAFTRIAQNIHFDYFTVTTEVPTPPIDDYYVSNEGDDTNDGLTESTAWKTLNKANEAVTNGGLLKPGGKLLFKKGDTFVGQLLIGCSGTEEKSIQIGSYGSGEMPILTGVGANLGVNNNGDAREVVIIIDASHNLMTDLHITNDRQVDLGWQGSGNSSYGIVVKATKDGGVSKGLTFQNLKFIDIFGVDMLDWEGKFTRDYYNAQGFFFDSEADHDGATGPPATEVGIDDVLIENCYFYNLGSRGIGVRHLGSYNNQVSDDERNLNYVIRNNHFEKLGGDGVVLASVNNGLVENNEFIDLGWGDHTSSTDRYFGRGEGCWIWDSHNILVQYNKQYRASGYGDTYGAAGHIDFYCKNTIFQYNYSEDTEGGFVEILGDCENSSFRYNVSVNDGHRANGHHRYSIWLSGYVGTDNTPIPSNNNYIYNNTIFLNKSRCKPDIEIFANNTYIYNNIFYAMNGAQIGAGGVSIDIQNGSELLVSNNLFYGDVAAGFTNLDTQKITGQDPLFENTGSGNSSGYKIQSNSAAVDSGKSFPQPTFPMAGTGIFKDVTLYPTVDNYGVAVDIENEIPNIGAHNAYNTSLMGIDSFDFETKIFSVYPNPVKDEIHIQIFRELRNPKITVYDIQGKSMFNTIGKASKQNLIISVPKTMKNGIYFVKLEEGTTKQTERIILYR